MHDFGGLFVGCFSIGFSIMLVNLLSAMLPLFCVHNEQWMRVIETSWGEQFQNTKRVV